MLYFAPFPKGKDVSSFKTRGIILLLWHSPSAAFNTTCGDFRVCFSDVEKIRLKLSSVKHKIVILSGKGGVGKSTFTAHLARAMAFDEETQVILPTFLRA